MTQNSRYGRLQLTMVRLKATGFIERLQTHFPAFVNPELNTTSHKSWLRCRFAYGRMTIGDGTVLPQVPKPTSFGLPPQTPEELARFWTPPDLRPRRAGDVFTMNAPPEIPALRHLNMPIPIATERNHYRQMHYYNTRAEAMAWKGWRDAQLAKVLAGAPPSLGSIRIPQPIPAAEKPSDMEEDNDLS